MLLYGRRKVLHDMRVQALQQGFDEVINVRVETSMITKKSGRDDRTAGYEFIAYGTAIKYARALTLSSKSSPKLLGEHLWQTRN